MTFFSTQSILAQDTNKKKEAKVKILIDKDEKSVKFDTIIHGFKDHKELIEIIKSKHLPDSLFDIFEGEDFIIFPDDENSDGKHKVIVKSFHTSDAPHHSKTIKINLTDNEDGHVILNEKEGEKVIIIKDHEDLTKDGDVKHIKIITTSKCDFKTDGDDQIEIEIEINEDGKQVKKIKKKRKKSKKQEKSTK